MRIEVPPIVAFFAVFLFGDAKSQLFDNASVVEGEMATLTCDVRKAAPNASVKSVNSLIISKKAASDHRFQTFVDYYKPKPSIGKLKKTHYNNPFSEEGKIDDRRTYIKEGMFHKHTQDPYGTRIVITFDQVLCEDGAIYSCMAGYTDQNQQGFHSKVNNTLNVIGRVKNLTGQINPEKKVYKDDDTVNITCLTLGPDNVAIRWKYQTCNATASVPNTTMHDWSPTTNIVNTNLGTIESGGCTYFHFKSVLGNAELSNKDRTICLIQCVSGTESPGGLFVEDQQWSQTISYVVSSTDENGENQVKAIPTDASGRAKFPFRLPELDWDIYLSLGVISGLLVVGAIVGVYDRIKDKPAGAQDEQNQNDQMSKKDAESTTGDRPHNNDVTADDTVEPGVASPPIITIEAASTTGVQPLTSESPHTGVHLLTGEPPPTGNVSVDQTLETGTTSPATNTVI